LLVADVVLRGEVQPAARLQLAASGVGDAVAGQAEEIGCADGAVLVEVIFIVGWCGAKRYPTLFQ
jgi:hypothetical protein